MPEIVEAEIGVKTVAGRETRQDRSRLTGLSVAPSYGSDRLAERRGPCGGGWNLSDDQECPDCFEEHDGNTEVYS